MCDCEIFLVILIFFSQTVKSKGIKKGFLAFFKADIILKDFSRKPSVFSCRSGVYKAE